MCVKIYVKKFFLNVFRITLKEKVNSFHEGGKLNLRFVNSTNFIKKLFVNMYPNNL